MKQAEQVVRQGERRSLAWLIHRRCWQDACRHDGIDPDTVFACFPPDNPYTPFLERLFLQYQEALAAFRVWGSIGLRLTPREGTQPSGSIRGPTRGHVVERAECSEVQASQEFHNKKGSRMGPLLLSTVKARAPAQFDSWVNTIPVEQRRDSQVIQTHIDALATECVPNPADDDYADESVQTLLLKSCPIHQQYPAVPLAVTPTESLSGARGLTDGGDAPRVCAYPQERTQGWYSPPGRSMLSREISSLVYTHESALCVSSTHFRREPYDEGEHVRYV